MNKFVTSLAAGALVCAAGAASAATVTHSDSYALTATDWDTTLSVAQFDSSLGTLNSVLVKLIGYVEGEATVKNNAASGSNITVELEATISTETPGLDLIVEVVPLAEVTKHLTGGEEWSTGLINDEKTDSRTLTGDEMDEFLGTGLIEIATSAVGRSEATGSGNMNFGFSNSASAYLEVTYDYTPATVPVPASAALLLGGLGVLAARRRAKKA